MGNIVNIALCRPHSVGISACVTPLRAATILKFERTQDAMERNELVVLERCLANIQKGYDDQDVLAIWEGRDELEVIALHTEETDIRERCRMALDNNKQASK